MNHSALFQIIGKLLSGLLFTIPRRPHYLSLAFDKETDFRSLALTLYLGLLDVVSSQVFKLLPPGGLLRLALYLIRMRPGTFPNVHLP
jgi:hypothetical protein